MRRPALLVPVLFLTLACAGGSSGSSGTTAPRPQRGAANFISNAEIEAAGVDANSAYDLVERLRPTMLRARNLTAGSGVQNFAPVVYVEDVRLGDIDQLRTVMRATVYEIRFINATDATTRWGTGHSAGVIQVRLKR